MHDWITSSVYFWIAQCFGCAALIFDVVKFTRKSRRYLLLWGIPAGWSMVASQYWMGQYQGASFQAMSSADTLLQSLFGLNTYRHRLIRIALATLFCVGGFALYSPTVVWWTWLPVGSYLFAVLGKIFHHPIHIRSVWLLSSTCTLIYAGVYGNWSIIVQQIVVMSLTMWTIVHYTQDASSRGKKS